MLLVGPDLAPLIESGGNEEPVTTGLVLGRIYLPPRASDSPVLEALLSSSWPATTPATPPTSSMSRAPATDELALVAGSSGPEESREDFCNSVRVALITRTYRRP